MNNKPKFKPGDEVKFVDRFGYVELGIYLRSPRGIIKNFLLRAIS
jgi:hypothetical protein